jgi:hypothetical protein
MTLIQTKIITVCMCLHNFIHFIVSYITSFVTVSKAHISMRIASCTGVTGFTNDNDDVMNTLHMAIAEILSDIVISQLPRHFFYFSMH